MTGIYIQAYQELLNVSVLGLCLGLIRSDVWIMLPGLVLSALSTDLFYFRPIRSDDWYVTRPIRSDDWYVTRPIRSDDWYVTRPIRSDDWYVTRPIMSDDWYVTRPAYQGR